MDFVYPFIHSSANDREINLSVASVFKFYRGKARVFIVGDNPNIKDVTHIPVKRVKGAFRDQINKLRVVIESETVADDFVWMMDDLFFVNEFTSGQIKLARHGGGRVGDRLDKWEPSNNWLKSKKKTMLALREKDESWLDFSVHCPLFLQRNNVRDMFKKWDLDNQIFEWKTIYGNVYSRDIESCTPWRWRWKGERSLEYLQNGVTTATVANCTSSGFTDAADNVLSKLLGVSSPNKKNKFPIRSDRINRVANKKRYQLGRHKPKKVVDWKADFGAKLDAENPCPINQRGELVGVKNNKSCGARSKNSVPVYKCNELSSLVTISPYKSAQPEGCCKRCDHFWEEKNPLVDYLKDKSIAVVGNGASGLHGPEIDSYDVVIRFNNYRLEGFEHLVGSKTTVWAHCKNEDVRRRSDDQFKFEFCPNPNDVKSLSDVDLITGEQHIFDSLGPKPSTGLSTVNWLFYHGFNFSLFGFDGFKTGHYFEHHVHEWHDGGSDLEAIQRFKNMQGVEAVIPWRPTESRQESFKYVLSWAKSTFHHVHLEQQLDNNPFNKSRLFNRGVEKCGSESIVFLLDADMMLPDEQIRQAVFLARTRDRLIKPFFEFRPFTRSQTEEIVGGKIPPQRSMSMDVKRQKSRSPGGITVVKRSIYKRLGGHDERYVEWGGEDNDFLIRARRLLGKELRVPGSGYHLWHEPNTIRPRRNKQMFKVIRKKK